MLGLWEIYCILSSLAIISARKREQLYSCFICMSVFLCFFLYGCEQDCSFSETILFICALPALIQGSPQPRSNRIYQGRCMGGSRGGWGWAGVRTPSLNNRKTIGFLSNTGLDPLNNHKATKHSMLDHHRHASETPFKWRFTGGPMMAWV